MYYKNLKQKEAFIKVPLSEIPKIFEIVLTIVFVSCLLKKNK